MTHMPGSSTPDWPDGLRRGAVRWSYRSARYESTVAFYRDLVQLPVLAEFSSSFGEDGTVLGLPDAAVHVEILRARKNDTAAIGHDEIVLYVDDLDALSSATARLREAGVTPDSDGHPYWQANGAVTYRDPDGRGLVFAPWVFGRVPDPVDRPPVGDDGSAEDGPMVIDWYRGDPQQLRALFEEAEDSPAQLDSYLTAGQILVARAGQDIVGHLQLVENRTQGEIELKSMAVVAARRGTGVGTQLVERAITAARASGHTLMTVATAAADIDNLRFYQRRGFRFSRVERDAFDAESGYAAGITIDGIALRDRVWFSQSL